MDAPIATAAPAPPATPDTISATRAAANTGSFADFDKAATSAREGKPLPDVPVTPPATPDAAREPIAESKAVSKRQQQINDYERRIAESDQRIRTLEAQIAPKHAAPAPVVAEKPTPDWKRIAALPDAPKLADFESVEEHTAAMALFVADQRHAERTRAAETDQDAAAAQTAHRARVDGFTAQLTAAKTADPTFVTQLTPEVLALKPFGALAPGEASGPRTVIAEQIVDSPIAPKVLLHLSQHPEALTALETMPPAIVALPAAARVKAHISWIVKAFAKLEAALETPSPAKDPAPAPIGEAPRSPISAAPPPVPTLSKAGSPTDPKASALARGDFATFDKLEMQAKRARLVSA